MTRSSVSGDWWNFTSTSPAVSALLAEKVFPGWMTFSRDGLSVSLGDPRKSNSSGKSQSRLKETLFVHSPMVPHGQLKVRNQRKHMINQIKVLFDGSSHTLRSDLLKMFDDKKPQACLLKSEQVRNLPNLLFKSLKRCSEFSKIYSACWSHTVNVTLVRPKINVIHSSESALSDQF